MIQNVERASLKEVTWHEEETPSLHRIEIFWLFCEQVVLEVVELLVLKIHSLGGVGVGVGVGVVEEF